MKRHCSQRLHPNFQNLTIEVDKKQSVDNDDSGASLEELMAKLHDGNMQYLHQVISNTKKGFVGNKQIGKFVVWFHTNGLPSFGVLCL